jgi:hypothetical protein
MPNMCSYVKKCRAQWSIRTGTRFATDSKTREPRSISEYPAICARNRELGCIGVWAYRGGTTATPRVGTLLGKVKIPRSKVHGDVSRNLVKVSVFLYDYDQGKMFRLPINRWDLRMGILDANYII